MVQTTTTGLEKPVGIYPNFGYAESTYTSGDWEIELEIPNGATLQYFHPAGFNASGSHHGFRYTISGNTITVLSGDDVIAATDVVKVFYAFKQA